MNYTILMDKIDLDDYYEEEDLEGWYLGDFFFDDIGLEETKAEELSSDDVYLVFYSPERYHCIEGYSAEEWEKIVEEAKKEDLDVYYGHD